MAGGSNIPHRPGADERRQVSTLFYDVVGSTELIFIHGVEWFRASVLRLHRVARATIAGYGGLAQQPQGDGGRAYFGYAVAQEDAAERAICTALDILAWVKKQTAPAGKRGGEPLQVRIAIATGTVLTDPGDPAHDLLPSVHGVAPALAARLQACAEPNSILVSEETYRITAGLFRFSPAGSIDLKGFPERVEAWRVLGKSVAASRFAALRSPQAPLLGRDAELGYALQVWESVAAGCGQTLLVVGEAGIGKSRFAMELRNKLEPVATLLPVLQCQPRESGIPLHPLTERLSELSRPEIGPGRSGDDGPSLELYPGIQTLRRELMLAVSSPDDTLEESLAHAESRRRAVIEAATRLVGNVTRQGPVVLCCEDVHWADPTTRDWLAHLQRWATDKPLLLLITARDAAGIVPLEGANVARIELPRLSADVIGRIVAFHWSASRALPPEVLEHVRTYSDGVPLFAEEITKLLARTATDPGARLVEQLISLTAMLKARVEQSGADGHVVQAASVLGRAFRPRVLKRMLKGQVAMAGVDSSLRCLQDTGLLQVGQTGLGLQYRFNHLLIQESIYAGLVQHDRTRLHRRALRALREANDNHVPDAVLADHAANGGLVCDAVLFLGRAGDAALRRGGLREARRHFEHALELIAEDGRGSPGSPGSELPIRIKLGALMTALDGPGAAATRQFYEQSFARWEHVAEAQPDDWFALCWGWWFTAKDFHQQWQRAQLLQRRTRRYRSPAVRLHALHCAWATNFNRGLQQEVLKGTAEGLKIYDRELGGDPQVAFSGHDAKVCALGERAQSYWLLGARELADTELDAAKAHLGHIPHVGSQAHLLDMEALLRFYEVELDALGGAIRRMRELADAHGLPALAAKASIFGGWLQAMQGQPRSGEALLREGLDRLAEIGTEEDFPVYADMLAQLLSQERRFEEAFRILDAAAGRAEGAGHAFWLPELYRWRGVTRHHLDPEGDAWRHDLGLARDLARSQGAWMLELRAIASEVDLDPHAGETWRERRIEIERSIAGLDLAQRRAG